MPGSLDARRRAIADALRAVAREPRRPTTNTPAAPTNQPAGPTVDAVVGAIESRLDVLSKQIGEVLARLDAVETTLLEAAWERPAATTPAELPAAFPPERTVDDDDTPPDERVSVPKIPLGEGRMSSTAAEALFGG